MLSKLFEIHFEGKKSIILLKFEVSTATKEGQLLSIAQSQMNHAQDKVDTSACHQKLASINLYNSATKLKHHVALF